MTCSERWLFMLCLVLCFLSGSSQVRNAIAEQNVYIEAIKVEGNQRVEKEAILTVVRTQPGDLLDYEQLDKDLKDIYRMKYFTDAGVGLEDGEKGKIVIFRVVEKPSIGEIVYKGNDHVKEKDLDEEVGIKQYQVLDDNEIKQSINRLMELYRKKGYFRAEIKSKIESLPNNEVSLIYEINEDEKVYIKEISFLGNKTFDKGDLKSLMLTSEKSLLSWFTSAGYLDEKKLEFDAYKITSFYHNNGFINAKVGAPEIIFDKELDGLKIVLEVAEGPQYSTRNISVDGDLIFPAEELLRKVKIGREKVFNREVVRNDINTLRELYVDEGFAYADVTPRTSEDKENFQVDIVYVISKGQKVRFERINILGNLNTRDKVIRRELKTIEGEYYSGEDLRRSQENLDRLGFFEEVEINTKKGSQEDLMALDVKVKERPTGSFSVGAGFSSQDSIFGVFEVAQNNLFGRGQTVKASFKLSDLTTQFSVDFREPWLFDTRLSGDINLYNWSQEYEDYSYNGQSFEEYTRDSFGGQLGIGYPIDWVDEYTRGSVSYGYDNSDIGNVPEEATLEWQDMEGENITSYVTIGFRRDTRNKPWETSKGSLNWVSFQYVGRFLGGDSNFNKIEASSSWYFPLFWDTVFMTRGSWGLIEEKAGGKLPVFHKFRLGGINTVRGFEYGDISPTRTVPYTVYGSGDLNFEDQLADSDGKTTAYREDPIGGERMMYFNFEYRFPLIKKQGFTGLVFFDCGNVFEDHEHYTFSGIRKSVGVGVRWYSPMGPLRLEWGKNLDPQGDESSSKWEFSMGGTF